jgi:hypothetical protein
MKMQNGTGGFLQMSMKNMLGDNPKLAEALLKAAESIKDTPVTESVVGNLTETYASRYIKPDSDAAAIAALGDIFRDLMGHVTVEIRDGIGEYYRILSNRGLPAYEWLLEAFHVASKKEDHKRNFPYVVGMIRCWMKYGFGHIPSQEEEEVVSYFEEVIGKEVTPQARLIIQHLMGVYGAIKVTRMIGYLERDQDRSILMAQALRHLLEEKFPDVKEKSLNVGQSV